MSVTTTARDVWTSTVRLLGSFGLACVILVLLLVLTLLGTLEQTEKSIYAVQKEYFESLFVVGDVLPIPLPGAYPLLALLFVNLIVGGMLRLRRSWSRLGVFTIHVGIALLLLGGLVEFKTSQKGHLTLYEGDRSATFQSYYDWEVVVLEALPEGDVREHVIPHDRFGDLGAGESVRMTSALLPFDLVLEDFLGNCQPRKVADGYGIDGVVLEPQPAAAEEEANVAGLTATVAVAGAEPQRAHLWGLQRAPWTFVADGRRWQVDLRKQSWPLPFHVHLKDFTRELHPGIGMAKSFHSDVSCLTGELVQDVRISMNEPLRREGYTLYQASWGPGNAGPGDRLFSTFAVVHNPADRVPLIACVIIALGLLLHFVPRLTRYIRLQNARAAMDDDPSGEIHEMRPPKRRRSAAAAAILFATLLTSDAASARAPSEDGGRWSKETVELAARLPVQDEGRVKPLSTLAAFSLLRIHHSRTCEDAAGNRLEPTEWLLDVLFHPELARTYPVFRVDSHEVVQSIGLDTTGKEKRDLYTYDELEPGRARLMSQAMSLSNIEAKDRSPLENQTVNLGHAVMELERLLHHLDYARAELDATAIPVLADGNAAPERTTFAHVLASGPQLIAAVGGRRAEALEPELERAASALLDRLSLLADNSSGLRLFPPTVAPDVRTEWTSPGELAVDALTRGPIDERHVAMLADFSALTGSLDRPTEFHGHLQRLSQTSRSLAHGRGELDKVDLEVTYYGLDAYTNALVLYLLAFALTAVTWLRPRWKWVHRAALSVMSVGLGIHVAGIVLRCMIRGRPPVSTLYETVLFVTATAVLVAIVIEAIDRRRLAGAMAPVLGALGLFLAMRFEEIQGKDTMPQLVAVLDTNFWLSTHVTCITLGYSAALLASAFAHVFLLGKVFGVRRGDDEAYRGLARMVYGTTCFALIFCVVGTILGGVWANESWGRFWGWDPKENGALMIVLAQLALLHGRMGGYLRAFGVAVCTIVTGCVVAFSWWGVNLLGVGLHSYGFTDGIWRALIVFYAIEGLVLAASAGWWVRSRFRLTPT